jgi:hypothetical protein
LPWWKNEQEQETLKTGDAKEKGGTRRLFSVLVQRCFSKFASNVTDSLPIPA